MKGATSLRLPLPPLTAGLPLTLDPAHAYRLERRLTQGGQGALWMARWRQADVQVVLKLAPAGTDALRREAQVLRQLRHRHVIGYQRSGEAGPWQALVLDAMHGSLRESVRPGHGGSLPPSVALRWGKEAAQGLAALHAAGYRHLDLKPDNLLLTPPRDGPQRIKLADLGVALPLTAAEHLLRGTPGWMAPEQMHPHAAGRYRTGAASDVFALGLLLHWLLTGRLCRLARACLQASRGAAPAETAAALQRAAVPPGYGQDDAADLTHALRAAGFAPREAAALVDLVAALCRWAPAERPPLAAVVPTLTVAWAQAALLAAPVSARSAGVVPANVW